MVGKIKEILTQHVAFRNKIQFILSIQILKT